MASWRTSLWQDRLLSAHYDYRRFWAITSNVFRKRKEVRLQDGPALAPPDRQAEILRDHLAETFRAEGPGSTEGAQAPLPAETGAYSVSFEEVSKIIHRLKGSKAPGIDGVAPVPLKHLPRKAVRVLTWPYNSCIRLGVFPGCWK